MKKWIVFISLTLPLLIVLPIYFKANKNNVEVSQEEEISIALSDVEAAAAAYEDQDSYTDFILKRIPDSNVFLDGHDHEHIGHSHDEVSDSELAESLFVNLWSGLHLKDKDMILSAFSSKAIQHSFHNEPLNFEERVAIVDDLMDEFYKPSDPIGVKYSYEEVDSTIRNAELIIQYNEGDIKLPIKLQRNLLSDHEMSMRIDTSIVKLTEMIKKQAPGQ